MFAVDGAMRCTNIIVVETNPENPFGNEGVLVCFSIVVLAVVVEKKVYLVLVHHRIVGKHS